MAQIQLTLNYPPRLTEAPHQNLNLICSGQIVG
jgi:hypothetical protein